MKNNEDYFFKKLKVRYVILLSNDSSIGFVYGLHKVHNKLLFFLI
jgi:hypothetical protein